MIYKFSYCKCCGKLIRSEYKEKLFCSKECRYNTIKVKKRNTRCIYEKTCKYCKEKFTTKNEKQIFCNNDHKKKYHEQLLTEKQCKTCKKIFKPKRIEQQYCCIKCSKPRKNEYFKNTCTTCGTLFESRYKDDITCSKCRIKFKNSNPSKCTQWHGKSCNYKDIKVMSTYELRTCNILDKMLENKLIYDWKYSKDKIKYIGIDNKQHNYIIDFKVFTSENTFYFLEVKGIKMLKDELKWEATKNSGFNLNVWFLNDIERKELELNITKDDIKYLLKTCVINKEVN